MENTAVLIVAIIFTSLAVQRYFAHKTEVKKLESEGGNAETKKLQQEVESLKQRVEVLEKIVTDKNYQLKEQFRDL